MVGSDRLGVQQIVDIVSGAIDAWLSSDVRRAIVATGGVREGGTMIRLRSLACATPRVRYTPRDARIGSIVMVLGGMAFLVIGIAAHRNGFPTLGEMLKAVAFPLSMLVSMPFWILKGQPWKAQVVLLGFALGVTLGVAYLGTLIRP